MQAQVIIISNYRLNKFSKAYTIISKNSKISLTQHVNNDIRRIDKKETYNI